MSGGLPVSVVHLNDFVDNNNTVLLQRLEDAFGVDGTNFWERFFLCEQRHNEDKLIYLFTQSQLKCMSEWYKNKRMLGENVSRNLNLSRQFFLNTSAGKKPKIKYAYYEKRFSYIRYKGNDPYITDTFRFSSSEPDRKDNEKSSSDFFDEVFIKSLKKIQILGGSQAYALEKLISLKKQIAEKILSPRRKKWLRYLGNKIVPNDPPDIEYCNEIDPSCPLVSHVFPPHP
jgi:hypothetical protein